MATIIANPRLWLALGGLLALGAVWWSGLGSYLSLETLRLHRAELTAWVATRTILAAAAFVLVYVMAVAFSVPGATVLTLAGGFLFGAPLGTLLAVLAATTGAIAVFLFARVLLGASALERLGPQAARLAKALRANAASYLLMLRLAPVFPFFLVNLVPAFAGVPLATFVLTTFIGIIPGTAVFALAGAGLGSVLDSGGAISPASVLTPEILAGLFGLAALSLASIPLRKRLGQRDPSSAGQHRIE